MYSEAELNYRNGDLPDLKLENMSYESFMIPEPVRMKKKNSKGKRK